MTGYVVWRWVRPCDDSPHWAPERPTYASEADARARAREVEREGFAATVEPAP